VIRLMNKWFRQGSELRVRLIPKAIVGALFLRSDLASLWVVARHSQ
jgi:hypothetical protein